MEPNVVLPQNLKRNKQSMITEGKCKESKTTEEFFMISSQYLTFEFQRYDLRNKPLDIYQKTTICSIIVMKKFVFAR